MRQFHLTKDAFDILFLVISNVSTNTIVFKGRKISFSVSIYYCGEIDLLLG